MNVFQLPIGLDRNILFHERMRIGQLQGKHMVEAFLETVLNLFTQIILKVMHLLWEE